MDHDIKEHVRAYYSFWRGLDGLYEKWAKKRGLNFHSFTVLYAVWENQNGACTQKMICKDWSMPKQTVHSILKQFQSDGYIQFEENQQDRRNKLVRLTGHGLEYAGGILSEMFALEEAVMRRMGPENRAAMTQMNNLFLNLFQEEMEYSAV